MDPDDIRQGQTGHGPDNTGPDRPPASRIMPPAVNPARAGFGALETARSPRRSAGWDDWDFPDSPNSTYQSATHNARFLSPEAETVSAPSSPQSYHRTEHPARPVSPLLDEAEEEPEARPTPTPASSGPEDHISTSTHHAYHHAVSEQPLVRQVHEKAERARGEQQKKQKVRAARKVDAWWWWEIAASALSILCMILLLVLLIKINGISLEAWSQPISPSSLIAVLTTVAKTSMMVPVAACISQLKWRHFQQKSDKLQNLQVFDDASRGPWGSTMMLFTFRKRAVLAWAFCLVTVIALGLDPSAQQIIEFPARTSPLTNVTAALGRADNYISRGYLEGDINLSTAPNSNLLKLQAAILNGASGAVFQPTLNCPTPASSCTWDNITTLGICSEFDNVTSLATSNCTGDSRIALNCTYSFPGQDEYIDPIVMRYNRQVSSSTISSHLFRSVSATSLNDTLGQYLAFAAVKVVDNRMSGTDTPPTTEMYQASLFWCARKYTNTTASPSGLDANAGTFEKLSFSSVVLGSDENNTLSPGHQYITYTAPSTGARYNISSKVNNSIWSYLGRFLSKEFVQRATNPREEGELDIPSFLYTSDLQTVTSNIAFTLTNQIRSKEPGDNSEADQATGTAFFKEVYINVRWGWFVLPIIETVLVAGLLAAVIVSTRGEALVKESVIAYFMYGLDERVRGELERQKPVTAEEMAEAAKINVRLLKSGSGQARFVGD
ncbi:hypothetical protein B0H67DRAFT_1701 [Lasiosphaeris hirsuta]|uniref:Uncharacterized protein n=1 Tax=Lasiosphaeris hirsuta TaxID=260670 RepID=A0AA40E773_9PEZI|nr:hypothetical protein B0H67DRAFT_1701 [Lasiosphaeris hirsuta]